MNHTNLETTQAENEDHIFATCSKTTETRSAINRWWTGAFEDDCDSKQDVFGLDLAHTQNISGDLIKDAVVQAYVWAIWKARNEVIFKGHNFNPIGVANEIKLAVFSRVCNRNKGEKTLNWFD